jgi:ABC-type glycerol-3-phosphate transport system substrate-binding protein
MRPNRIRLAALTLAALAGLAGCSAISFFPYAAAEKAADRVLDEITSANGAPEESPKPVEPKNP